MTRSRIIATTSCFALRTASPTRSFYHADAPLVAPRQACPRRPRIGPRCRVAKMWPAVPKVGASPRGVGCSAAASARRRDVVSALWPRAAPEPAEPGGLPAYVPTPEAPEPAPEARTPRRLRRLANFEMEAVIRDLLGEPSLSLGSIYLPDPRVEGYDNDAVALGVSESKVEEIVMTAERVAAHLTAGESLQRHAPCPAGEDPGPAPPLRRPRRHARPGAARRAPRSWTRLAGDLRGGPDQRGRRLPGRCRAGGPGGAAIAPLRLSQRARRSRPPAMRRRRGLAHRRRDRLGALFPAARARAPTAPLLEAALRGELASADGPRARGPATAGHPEAGRRRMAPLPAQLAGPRRRRHDQQGRRRLPLLLAAGPPGARPGARHLPRPRAAGGGRAPRRAAAGRLHLPRPRADAVLRRRAAGAAGRLPAAPARPQQAARAALVAGFPGGPRPHRSDQPGRARADGAGPLLLPGRGAATARRAGPDARRARPSRPRGSTSRPTRATPAAAPATG